MGYKIENKCRKIAIIPARGGSERIPNKNIRDFCGQPMITYSIMAALKTGIFDEVMVSTDSGKIAEIAKNNGAKIPFFRSASTSDSHAALADVISEVLQEYEKLDRKFDSICCILATAPFISSEMLAESWKKLTENDYTSVIPVQKFSFPIQRAFSLNEKGFLNFIFKEHAKTRSQDLEETFHDAGLFYWVKSDSFKEEQTLLTKKAGAFNLPTYMAHDIDNEEDWKSAEIKFRMLQSE